LEQANNGQAPDEFELQLKRPNTPEIPDGDFIEEENKFLPQPERWVPPRLFLINNDNTAIELLEPE
jgi:hypothetical protein